MTLDVADGVATPVVRSQPKGFRGSFLLPFTLARRELRGGLEGFRVFLACLTLGVAAIASVGSVADALVEGLAQEGQSILGGDVDLRLMHRPASADELAFLAQRALVSETRELRGMATATTTGQRTLVELKGVDGVYPLYGTMDLRGDVALVDALARRDGIDGVVVEEVLLTRLGVDVGDRVKIGDREVEIRAVIEREPDRVAGGFAIGPRVMMTHDALERTGLVRLGSMIYYHYRVRLPDDAQRVADVRAWVEDAKTSFPDAGWRITERSNSAPGVRRFVERVALFLTLVGLTALVVGGVGVGNAVRAYLETKRETIATFKCLGAPGALVFNLYLVQVMALALVGIAIGLAIGAAVPFLVQATLADLLPIPARFDIYWGPLVLAAAYGFLTAFAFAIWPLARAREVAASGLFRDIVAPNRTWPRPAYVGLTVFAFGILAALAIGLSDQRQFAMWFVVGTAFSFLILRATALLLEDVARRAGRPRLPELRLALANLHRPGSATASVVLSLGLGLTLLVTISQIDGNLSQQVRDELPDRAPSFFFLDMQPDQIAGFNEIIAATPGITQVSRVPMLRGRIVDVNGTPSEELVVAPNAAWALRGDRGLTYSATLPEGSKLVRGEWWPADYAGETLVSLTEEIAQGFGVEIGDEITVNVLGRRLTATIANTRSVDWASLGINFVMVFSPGALSAAPHTHLATVTMDEAEELALQRAVTDRFANITAVRVKEALSTVSSLLEDLVLAVRATSVVTLAAGVLVLAGAMAAGFRRRVYDAVVLKVLGATRRRVVAAYLIEYAILGLGTALISAGIGTLAAYIVITEIMEGRWTWLPGTILATTLGAMLLTIVLGLLGTWRALSEKAAPVLRTE